MREILFRGKRKDNGEWVYGVPVPIQFNSYMTKRVEIVKYHGYDELDYYNLCSKDDEVIPETVGQYTGLCDKNGNKIFEGDIVKAIQTEYDEYKESEPSIFSFVGEMIFDDACFGLKAKKGIDFYSPFWKEEEVELEVIGNIYDNKNLLEEQL